MIQARKSLAVLLHDAAHAAGSWKNLAPLTGITYNTLWRNAQPVGATDKKGRLYAETLPRGDVLEQIMDRLGLIFTKGEQNGVLADVLVAIRNLEGVDEHTKAQMSGCMHALWQERGEG
ncbi:MAG: hypothetical protein V3S01_01025 [Dehalococcoidia bacterium]